MGGGWRGEDARALTHRVYCTAGDADAYSPPCATGHVGSQPVLVATGALAVGLYLVIEALEDSVWMPDHSLTPLTVLRRVSALLLGSALCWSMDVGAQPAAARDTAIFAGGCFWCMEEAYEQIDGVLEVRSGYIGGTVPNPTYRQVTRGRTGHYEAIEVLFDPARVSYAQLVSTFWRNIDPTDARGQFCDKGDQYRAAIFPRNEQQRTVATAAKADLDGQKRFPQPVAAAIVAATRFYVAEGYHQDYYKKNPGRYKFYKFNCGRAQRLAAVWGKP